jgi:hypothetical protein
MMALEPAGSSMLAHIVVDNRTGHAIHAEGCGTDVDGLTGLAGYGALEAGPWLTYV